jgi:hypothetical protein
VFSANLRTALLSKVDARNERLLDQVEAVLTTAPLTKSRHYSTTLGALRGGWVAAKGSKPENRHLRS